MNDFIFLVEDTAEVTRVISEADLAAITRRTEITAKNGEGKDRIRFRDIGTDRIRFHEIGTDRDGILRKIGKDFWLVPMEDSEILIRF